MGECALHCRTGTTWFIHEPGTGLTGRGICKGDVYQMAVIQHPLFKLP